MKKITSKLLIAEIEHPSGLKITYPHFLPELFQLNMPPWRLADRLANAIHTSWLKEGKYGKLILSTLNKEFERLILEVDFQASKDGLFPDMKFEFDLFYCQVNPEYYLGFIPVLNLQSVAPNLEELRDNATDNIRLEFIRKHRKGSLFPLLSTQWQNACSIHSVPVDHFIYSLQELERMKMEKTEQILKQVTSPLPVHEGKLFGLEEELGQLIQAMKGQNRNSVLIIGGTGKGKTELIEEFNRRKADHGLEGLNLQTVTAGQLIHRLSGMGRWEEYLADLCRDLRQEGHVLYLPNFSELFEVGQYVGNDLSIADYLRPYITRGDIAILSECTPEEASRIELRSPGYLGALQTIKIRDMEHAQLQEVVVKKSEHISQRKQVNIQPEAVQEILRLQQWYTPYSGLPGKTIAFLEALATEKDSVDIDAVYHAFCQETGMPEFMVNPHVPLTYAQIEQFFHQNIYGQEEAIETLAELLFAIKAAVIKRGKPLASLLFVGPTGVGKTEMAKVLAYFLFGDREKMVRFDMSEYSDLASVMRLTGDSYGGEGLLTATVRQNPFSVILFDELEKVHYAFYDLLLQILGEGRLTDSKGRVADFCSTIIIMTSNIGARAFQTGSVGFGDSREQQRDAGEHFKKAVQAHFRPELFNRLDRIIAFAPLDKQVIRQIVDREMQLILNRQGLQARKVNLKLTPEALDYLGEKGYNALYGARHLQRTLRESLIIPLSEQLNTFEYNQPLDCDVMLEEDKLEINLKKSAELALMDQVLDKKANFMFTDFLEAVSNDRRGCRRVANGHVFNRLLSQLDKYNRRLAKLKKKNQEAEFWQNQVRSKAYHQLTEMDQELHVAIRTIEEIEADNLLLLSELGEDQEHQLSRYREWEKGFFKIKTDLLKWEMPTYSTCTVGIYGPIGYINSLVKVYLDLGEKMQAEVKPYSIWFDKMAGTPDKEIQHLNPVYKELSSPEGDESGEGSKAEEEHTPYYVCLPYAKANPGQRYRQVGVEITFHADLVFLYLVREKGVHFWKDKNGNRYKYSVLAMAGTLKDFKTPDEIHRQSYFAQAKFRHYSREYKMMTGLKDVTYQIDRQGKNFAELLWPKLQETFTLQLNIQLSI